jgi:hypothetical protein
VWLPSNIPTADGDNSQLRVATCLWNAVIARIGRQSATSGRSGFSLAFPNPAIDRPRFLPPPQSAAPHRRCLEPPRHTLHVALLRLHQHAQILPRNLRGVMIFGVGEIIKIVAESP